MEKTSHSKKTHHENEDEVNQPHFQQDVRTILSWTGPSRPFREKTRQFYLSALLIVFFVEMILFLFSQYEAMAAVLGLLFLSFVLASTSPQNFHYRISSEGIAIEDHYYIWQELYDFYFKKEDGIDVVHIRTHDFIPGELKIPLDGISREHMRKVLIQFLPYREMVRQTFTERSADWLSRNFPLEDVK